MFKRATKLLLSRSMSRNVLLNQVTDRSVPVPLPHSIAAIPTGTIKVSKEQLINSASFKHELHETMTATTTSPCMGPGRNDSCVSDALTRSKSMFDPKKHLAFNGNPEIVMMKDIGYAEDLGVSPVAVVKPFQLFTPEAVQIMRSEILRSDVMDNYQFSSNIAPAQVRGYARDRAPFTYDAWNDPQTLAIISRLAGIDLVPVFDYEIGHINLSKTGDQIQSKHVASKKGTVDGEEPVVKWHKDSYPFVCVLMLSDCKEMVGGETVLQTGHGTEMHVRGPSEGCAVILQGLYITHQALPAQGMKERITSVTSFCPRDPLVKDESVLTTVRPVSNLNELYYDYTESRLKIMEYRIKHAREELRARRSTGQDMDVVGNKSFLAEMSAFTEHMNRQLVHPDQVEKGYIKTLDAPKAVVAEVSSPETQE